jgi:hypothetical protein
MSKELFNRIIGIIFLVLGVCFLFKGTWWQAITSFCLAIVFINPNKNANLEKRIETLDYAVSGLAQQLQGCVKKENLGNEIDKIIQHSKPLQTRSFK